MDIPFLLNSVAAATQSGGAGSSILSDFGDAWKSLLVLVAFAVLLIFQKQLKDMFPRLKGYKYGKHTLDLADPKPPAQTPAPIQGESVPPPAERTDDEPIATEPETPPSLSHEVLQAILARDIKMAEEAYDRLQAQTDDPQEKTKHEMRYWSWRYQLGSDESAIAKLESLAEDPDKRYLALRAVGNCYRQSREFEKASDAYSNAYQAAKSDKAKAKAVSGIAHCQAKLENAREAIARIEQTLAELQSTDAKSTLFEALADVYGITGDARLRSIALEKLAELKPTDTSVRFDVAWAQMEAKLRNIAISNYRTLLSMNNEHTAAWNNLGVLYQNLETPIHSVRAYRRASDRDDTLASANLAYLFLNAGFKDEASAVLNKAMTAEERHPNVGQAIAKTTTNDDDESKRIEDATDKGGRMARFLRAFADAYFTACAQVDLHGGQWSLAGEEVKLTMDGAKFTARWGKKEDAAETLTGTLHNAAAEVIWNKKASTNVTLLHIGRSGPESGYAYFDAASRELRTMLLDGDFVHFLTLYRS